MARDMEPAFIPRREERNLISEVLFVQGGGRGAHDEWDNKLVDSLARELGRDYEIRYPRMPGEEEPTFASWKPALEKELKSLSRDAILVGHSVGATILLGVLAERTLTLEIAAILLISAPFVGNGGWPSDGLRFPSDLGARLPKGVPVHFYQGLADDVVPASHIDHYLRAVPGARVHRLRGRDHQLNNDLSEVASAISSLGKHGARR